MAEILVDSSIMIDATNEHVRAVAYINNLLNSSRPGVHALTIAEVIVGARDAKELYRLRRFLRPFEVAYPSQEDIELALESLGRLHLSHDVDFPDCLIAATVLRLDITVATVNDRHFRLFKGLKVFRPYQGAFNATRMASPSGAFHFARFERL